MILDKDALRAAVRDAMHKTDALDLWTNLPADPMANDACNGIDALLAAQESLRGQARALGHSLPEERSACAAALFQALYAGRLPISDAAMRALLSLERMGMEPATRDMADAGWQAQQKPPSERMEWVLELAKLRGIACTVDPFEDGAGESLEKLREGRLSPRLLPVLAVETLQRALMRDAPVRGPEGEIERDRNGAHLLHIAELLAKWAAAVQARMVRAAWPSAALEQDMLMRYALLPFCEESGLPLALEFSGRQPELEKQLDWVWEVLRSSAQMRFVLAARTARAAEALLARWAQPMGERVFCVLATEKCLAREAIGAAGTQALPFASGAAVLEQTIGDWVEARREIAQALYDRYLPLVKMKWGVQSEEIEADAACVLGGNWERFLSLHR
ncbi:MAG: hypothetical protein FWE77_01740 [Clostridia bacterium]|nr:hypothetical protein [Clostridia bacterium]